MGQDYWGILTTSIGSVGWDGIQPVDCGPLCTLSLGLTVAQALVMRCNMSGALIKRHPHMGLTSDCVQFLTEICFQSMFKYCATPLLQKFFSSSHMFTAHDTRVY